MVPSFHCTFLPGMPSSPTPGSPTSICSRISMPTWPSPIDHRLGTPDPPAIRSARVSRISWLHWFASATACQVARPPVRIRLGRPALGDFYFQAFNGSVSLPVAGYNYNSGWISFCWRDLHPLEWQLASLHGQGPDRPSCPGRGGPDRPRDAACWPVARGSGRRRPGAGFGRGHLPGVQVMEPEAV